MPYMALIFELHRTGLGWLNVDFLGEMHRFAFSPIAMVEMCVYVRVTVCVYASLVDQWETD